MAWSSSSSSHMHAATRFSYGYDQLEFFLTHTTTLLWCITHCNLLALFCFCCLNLRCFLWSVYTYYTLHICPTTTWVKYLTRSSLLKLVPTQLGQVHAVTHIHAWMLWILSNCLTSLPLPTSHTFVPGNAPVLRAPFLNPTSPYVLFFLTKTCAGWGTCFKFTL